MSDRENYLRAARFQNPERIPTDVGISDASWDYYRGEMEQMALHHPDFFPYVNQGWRDYDQYDFGPAYRKGEPFNDNWGCRWETPMNGIEGVVTYSPLKDWTAYGGYSMPDIETQDDRSEANWGERIGEADLARKNDELIFFSLPHGFLFLRLTYLRGFENMMCDMADEDPRFVRLFDELVAYNLKLVERYVKIGADVMGFPDDLGTQTGSIVSPAMFEKWFEPAYRKLMAPSKKANILTHFHSDGKTLDILESQIRAGVDIVNPQDLANGIDNLAKYIKGHVCIDLDIDRQSIIPYGTRMEIFELVEEEVKKLGSPSGGLMLSAGIYPPTPPDNVDALCSALRKYQRYWWD